MNDMTKNLDCIPNCIHLLIRSCWLAILYIYPTLHADGFERASVVPGQLTCEYLREPLAVSAACPRVSWQLEPTDPSSHGSRQIAYQIRAASRGELLLANQPDLWDTGRVESSETLHVTYQGHPLSSGKACYWQVRLWDEHNIQSEWSSIARWRAGLLQASDWHGDWIGKSDDHLLPTANQYYRRKLSLTDKCADAIIYIASLGYHEVYVNGERLSNMVLAPAISDPLHRVRYVAYDATPFVHRGENVVCVALGAGWTLFNGHGWTEAALARWPKRPALRVQGVFRDAAGVEIAEIYSDDTWKTHPADLQPIRRWQFRDFNGERQTAQPLGTRGTELEFKDDAWSRAEIRTGDLPSLLTAQEVEPNRIASAVRARQIKQTAPGVYHVTLDRMFTGFLDVRLRGRSGAPVTIEVSDRADVPCIYGQQHELTLDSTGRGTFRNQFNYACGQWLTIRGDIDPPALDDVIAHMVSTDLRRTGYFRCSDEFHNQLYETSLHTLECLNLGGYVVDCAHRERLGYGGDGQVTAMAMLPNYACGAFYTKWLRDWCDLQQPNGNLPFTAPTYGGGGGPAWSGFLVHEAADLYERFADREILRETLPHIRRWLEFLETRTSNDQLQRYDGPPDYVQHEWSFLGDWVYPGHVQAPNQDDPMTDFFNNCYYAWTLRRAATLAEVVGETDDAAEWHERGNHIAAATHRKYWDKDANRYTVGRQANLAVAIVAEIAPPEFAPAVEQQLVDSIAATHDHVDTGIGGTLFLLRALQKLDRPDLVFRMASQRDFPGWGKMLDDGATAIWEQWDGEHSRCHSSYLGIGGWYLESIAGIQHEPHSPGYSKIVFKPGVVDGLDWAEGSLDSPRGKIQLSWKRRGNQLEISASVPPNTTASLHFPHGYVGPLRPRSATTNSRDVAESLSPGPDRLALALESGHHSFHFLKRESSNR